MPVLALGISFRRAPVELLERLAFADGDLLKAYRHAEDLDGLDETVVLSTCNRVEIYGAVAGYHPGFLALKRLLTDARSVPEADLADALYAHWERDAAEHLFSVTAGLDSMVLGETQIQAQVRGALRSAQAEGAAGPVLTGLFHAATRSGRRVRQETSVGAAPDAFVEAGATMADAALGGLDGRRVVVIGAGTMAALAVKHLRRRGVGPIRILNRSIEHARTLAARTDAAPDDLRALPDGIREADLVVSATASPATVIPAELVRTARAGVDAPLVLLDLAVPRDVEPDAAGVPGVTVIGVEDLRRAAPAGDADTISRAREIVSAEVGRFVTRRRGDELAPLIRAIRRRGDAVMRAELDRHAARLAELTPDERAAVDALARGIVAKLLHDPIVTLKETSDPGSARARAQLLAQLLALDPDGE